MKYLYVISDLDRDRKEICTILEFYVAFNNNNNYIQKFRDNLLV
jgi:hypothetical protein